MPNRTEWMAKGSYGLMVHYLNTPKGNTEEERTADFNRIVDSFDLDYFMKQFEASKADWLIFTIGQNTGYYNSPNAFLDKALPGRTSRRDLVLEIAKRVKALGKRFIAYMPVEVAGQSPEIHKAFAWNPADQTEFLNRYLQFVTDYSRKLGTLADGWWFDGAYDHIHEGKWDWARWNAAARTGNPNGATAYNDGAFCVGRDKPVTPLQDYHAGEVHLMEDGKIRFDFIGGNDAFVNADGHLVMPTATEPPKFYMPTAQYRDGVQWQALVPLDSTFNGAVPAKYCEYPAEVLIKFILDCRKVNGAVTYNLPIAPDGHIPEATMAKIRQVGKAVDKAGLL